MKKILLPLLSVFSLSVFADFTSLNTEQTQQAIKNGVAIIDIRRPDEFQRYGTIPSAHKLTFFDERGQYNTTEWLKKFRKIVKDKDQPFILVCAHANRTKTVGRFLSNKLGYTNSQELSGGIINGWIDKGLATTKIAAGEGKPWYKLW
ncbi:hypothetical protein SPBRAN_1739 [uncultured Candidatus Thioglobus sp.]|nr:hypothetical protein SPBRAN_1739 [uncultured Candidatus Thioglobus sp.]